MRGLIEDGAGLYRRHPVRIVGSAWIPPNWVKVPDAMAHFIEHLRDTPHTEHPVRVAARAHIELAAIHPFLDGNGRVSRMLVNVLLMKDDYPPALYTATSRAQYLTALEKAQVDGIEDDFVGITADAVETMLDRTLELVDMEIAANAYPAQDEI